MVIEIRIHHNKLMESFTMNAIALLWNNLPKFFEMVK